MKTLLLLFISIFILSCSMPKKYHKSIHYKMPKYVIVFIKKDTTYWNGVDSISFTKEIIIDYTLDLRTGVNNSN